MARKKKVEQPKGFGDTLLNLSSAIGLDKVAEKVSEVLTGDSDCGCGARAEVLNKMFPYSSNQDQKYIEVDGERIRLMN